MTLIGNRCPQCGYPVDNYFEHIDKNCNSDDAAEAQRKGVPYCPPDDEDEDQE